MLCYNIYLSKTVERRICKSKKQNRLFADLNLGETTMKVDESLCIGCGLCVRIAPDCFCLTEGEKSAVKKGADKNSPQAQQAMASCPMAAIYED